jgi:uncharacterized cupin superfamily protein
MNISNKTQIKFNMINYRGGKLTFLIVFLLFAANTYAQSWNEVIRVTASKPDGGNKFGGSVSIFGDWAIVGAPYNGLDENESDYERYAGSAYIFKKDTQGNWTQTQKICGAKRYSDQFFGCSVSISDKYIIVGAFGKGLTNPKQTYAAFKEKAGAAYIFEKNSAGVWKESQRLTASEIGFEYKFGYSVSISGEYAIVGADRSKTYLVNGAAFIFERKADGTWTEVQKLAPTNGEKYDEFGQNVCISGNYALVGAQKFVVGETNYVGAVHVYERSSKGTWKEAQRLTASDMTRKNHFGESISISGDYIVVGAYGSKTKEVSKGAAYIFKKSSKGKWKESQKLIASNGLSDDSFGTSVSMSGKYLVIGAEGCDVGAKLKDAGSAYVFELSSEGSWQEIKTITASDAVSKDNFGASVCLSGKNLIVGAMEKNHYLSDGSHYPGAGACYMFKK